MVSRILGHASIATTADVYGHLTDACSASPPIGRTSSSEGWLPAPKVVQRVVRPGSKPLPDPGGRFRARAEWPARRGFEPPTY